MPSGAGTVVLLSRALDGRLFALREHLRGVRHRTAALPPPARSARRPIPAPMDIDRRRRPDSDRFRGRSFRVVREHLSFAGADRGIIWSGRRLLRDARPRFGVERLHRGLCKTEGGLLKPAYQSITRSSKSK